MDLSIFWPIIFFLIVGFGLVIYFMNQKMREIKNTNAVELLKSDLTEISRNLNSLQTVVGNKLEQGQQNMQTSMHKQLTESNKLVNDVSERLAKFEASNKRVEDVADELKSLQHVLSNPKQRGVFGEYYLQTVLENVLPVNNFKMQYKFKDGEVVDAVIFLDKGQILPVDSKFSLENYNRMIAETNKTEKEKLLQKVRNDLKSRIDETSKYIRQDEKTMDFAFMFIPSESLYYDLLIGGVGSGSSARDLIEYAFRDKKVIVVSPTSFMAYLQTVLQGLRSLQIEKESKEIQIRVGLLGQHIAKFDSYMQKLGSSLGTTVNHFNFAHKELSKVDKDVIKIAGNDKSVELLEIDKPNINQ